MSRPGSTYLAACFCGAMLCGSFVQASPLPDPPSGDDAKQEKGDEPKDPQSELEELLKEFEQDEQAKKNKQPNYDDPKYRYRMLGVDDPYMRRERFRLRAQILTFIPPLYQPAFLGHGYVLPPNTWRVGVSPTFFDVESDDFFKDNVPDITHEDHEVERSEWDLDVFYGLDHDFTVRVKIPFITVQSQGSVHPAGVMDMDLFVEGATSEVGDVELFLKKKFWDQANRGFNFAGVIGVKLPTGSDNEKFDRPMVVRDPMGALGVAFGGGPFPRFSDDGRLPSVLQPGTGAFGYQFGLFGTRQFQKHRAAFHAGFLARFLNGNDGVEPGDELRFFATYVKAVYKDYLSVELAVNGMDKESDRYDGTFTHPVPDPDTGLFAGMATTERPPFREGTVVFATPSVIFIPNPWLRFTVSAMFRLNEPELGPWPDRQLRFGATVTF